MDQTSGGVCLGARRAVPRLRSDVGTGGCTCNSHQIKFDKRSPLPQLDGPVHNNRSSTTIFTQVCVCVQCVSAVCAAQCVCVCACVCVKCVPRCGSCLAHRQPRPPPHLVASLRIRSCSPWSSHGRFGEELIRAEGDEDADPRPGGGAALLVFLGRSSRRIPQSNQHR